MKLFGFLRKPGWEHKDAAVRLRTVTEGTEPGLDAVLPELAQRDPDAEVRRAALRRVDDPVLLARRMRGDADPQVAAVARERLVARLCAAALPHEQAVAVLLDMPDAELLAAVASGAATPALRRVALEQIHRPGFLFERCLNDPAWLLRRGAATRRCRAPRASAWRPCSAPAVIRRRWRGVRWSFANAPAGWRASCRMTAKCNLPGCRRPGTRLPPR